MSSRCLCHTTAVFLSEGVHFSSSCVFSRTKFTNTCTFTKFLTKSVILIISLVGLWYVQALGGVRMHVTVRWRQSRDLHISAYKCIDSALFLTLLHPARIHSTTANSGEHDTSFLLLECSEYIVPYLYHYSLECQSECIFINWFRSYA